MHVFVLSARLETKNRRTNHCQGMCASQRSQVWVGQVCVKSTGGSGAVGGWEAWLVCLGDLSSLYLLFGRAVSTYYVIMKISCQFELSVGLVV